MKLPSARISWYWRRFRAMSTTEVVRRVGIAGRKWRWQVRSSWNAPRPSIVANDRWYFNAPKGGARADLPALLEEANEVLRGRVSLLSCTFDLIDIDWHFDPHLRVRSPVAFAQNIDYRDTKICGNVKNIWELNRHHHLTLLAAAYAATKNPEYAGEVERELLSWVRANPPQRGVNWRSGLELGVRLISWVWTERLLRGSSAHPRLFGETGIMWPAVYWHQWFIRKGLSHDSSSNNHLIGELAGLFVAAVTWPHFPQSREWHNVARAGLERESVRQTFASGLNREQAFSYHLFVLELLVAAGVEGDRSNGPFSASFKSVVQRMVEVLPLLEDAARNLPRYGDADDGVGILLRAQQASRLDFLYCVASAWLGAAVPRPPGGSGLLAAEILVPPDARPAVEPFCAPSGSQAFVDAGFYVLARERRTPRELFCTVDAGPLGYLSIAAHGHADALAFTLNVGGQPVIVDSGTFSYFLEVEGREYFRSTKAHNTITIAEQSQSVPGGPFLWSHKACARVIDWRADGERAALVAEHDGYARLDGRPIHRRTFELDADGLGITDQLVGKGQQEVQWRLHFHPACTVTFKPHRCIVRWSSGRLEIVLDGRLNWTLQTAGHDAGWYSRAFDVKEPTTTLVGAGSLVLPFRVQHRITVYHNTNF
jgi:hypothetical protein